MSQRRAFAVTIASIASLFTSAVAVCHHGTYLMSRSEASSPKWDYDGLEGPLAWHALAEANSACALGKNQSPINIMPGTTASVRGDTLGFEVDSYPEGAELENLGSTVEVMANGTITLRDAAYRLAQFHFHTPSEHRIDNVFYPMEVHFVFQSQSKCTMEKTGQA